MDKRIVITGLGVVSSIGIGWKGFWDSLINGRSGISPVTAFDTSNHFTHYGGQVHDFSPERFSLHKYLKNEVNRTSQMAIIAAQLAAEDSRVTLRTLEKCRAGVSFGTTLGDVQTMEKIDNLLVEGETVSRDLAQQLPTYVAPSLIASRLRCKGPLFMFSTACAAGNYAVSYGFDLIKMNRVDIFLAGASDAFSRVGFTGFNQFGAIAPQKCQPFDKNRKGMIVAEGAGILILESLENAIARGANIYAEILGYGLSCDAHHMTTPSVAGIAECMRKAIKESGISIDNVDYISAHGTGTVANDRNECAAIKEVFGDRCKQIPVSSIKSMIGHTMGAASALEAITCALVVKNDIIPPTINYKTPDPECDIDCVPNKARNQTVNIALNNSYAFGGNNACLVIRKYNNQ